MNNRQELINQAHSYVREKGYQENHIASLCKSYGDIFGVIVHIALFTGDHGLMLRYIDFVSEKDIGKVFASYSMGPETISLFLAKRKIPTDAIFRALGVAVSCGRVDSASLLLSQPGLDVSALCDGIALISQAVFNRKPDLVNLLVAHLVTHTKSKQAIQEALDRALCVAAENNSFQRVLFYGICQRDRKRGVVTIMGNHGEEEYQRNKKMVENNALESLDIVKTLIENGANIHARDRDNQTVSELASKAYFFEPVVEYLESIRAKQANVVSSQSSAVIMGALNNAGGGGQCRAASSSSQAAVPAAVNHNQEVYDLRDYSLQLKAYILSFKDKPKLSERIKNLNLSSEEEALFEKFTDSISEEYMDIPVALHERYYDFESLRKLKSDPFSNEAFSPLEIQSARRLIEELEVAIANLEHSRKERAANNRQDPSQLPIPGSQPR